MIKQKDVILKTFWLISILSLLALSIYVVLQNITDYLDYSTSSVYEEMNIKAAEKEVPNGVLYPDATVCNMNPFSSTGSKAVIPYTEYVDTMVDTLTAAYNISQMSKLDKEAMSVLISYPGYFQNIGYSSASRVGHMQESFIVACDILIEISSTQRYKVPCGEYGIITQYVSPQFFNCYTIHPDMGAIASNLSGTPIGMSLILYLDKPTHLITDYFEEEVDDTQSHGARLTLHQPATLPDMLHKSFDMSPGYYTNIQSRISIRQRMSSPYGDCHPKDGVTFFDISGRQLVYSMLTCLSACSQTFINLECNCLDPSLSVVSALDQLELPYCAKHAGDNISETVWRIQCSLKAQRLSNIATCYDMCGPECAVVEHSGDSTFSMWPRKSQQLWFYRKFVQNKPYASRFTKYQEIWNEIEAGNEAAAEEMLQQATGIEDNFVKVVGSLTTLSVAVIKDRPLLTLTSLMSQMGGALNLYSGISVIVAVECLELLYLLTKEMSKKLLKCSTEKTDSSSDGNIKDRTVTEEKL